MVSTQISGTSLLTNRDVDPRRQSEDTGMRRGTAPASQALKKLGNMDAGADSQSSTWMSVGQPMEVC